MTYRKKSSRPRPTTEGTTLCIETEVLVIAHAILPQILAISNDMGVDRGSMALTLFRRRPHDHEGRSGVERTKILVLMT